MRYKIFCDYPDAVEKELNTHLDSKDMVRTLGVSAYADNEGNPKVTIVALVGKESEFAGAVAPPTILQAKGIGNVR